MELATSFMNQEKGLQVRLKILFIRLLLIFKIYSTQNKRKRSFIYSVNEDYRQTIKKHVNSELLSVIWNT